jgi:hypothetical protein
MSSLSAGSQDASKPMLDPALRKKFYRQKVVSTSKFTRPGTFFNTVQALAGEPIALGELVIEARDAFADKFTTKKDPTFVASIRVRHALTRLGYLKIADDEAADLAVTGEPEADYATTSDLVEGEAESRDLTVADAVWIGTALLQRENPEKCFDIKRIVDTVREHCLSKGDYNSIWQHVNQHCVANRKPRPNRSRMLFAVGEGERRLYRAGDRGDPERDGAPTHPSWDRLPAKYRDLQFWYEEGWNRPSGRDEDDPLLALAGTWKDEPADIYVARLRKGWSD